MEKGSLNIDQRLNDRTYIQLEDGRDIEITVRKLDAIQVRLNIVAPITCNIVRLEAMKPLRVVKE